MRLLLGAEYRSLAELAANLAELERTLQARGDRRAIFATAYVIACRELRRSIDAGQFEDAAWVTQCALGFANLYRQALASYEDGDIQSLPKSWRLAFDTAVNGAASATQDLLLGINAHINYDIPVALSAVRIDPNRPARRRDFTTLSGAFSRAAEQMREGISQVYPFYFRWVERVLSRPEQGRALAGLMEWRDAAWEAAALLADISSEEERRRRLHLLDERARLNALQVLAPAAAHPTLFQMLRRYEVFPPG